jgi:hypothetical protein
MGIAAAVQAFKKFQAQYSGQGQGQGQGGGGSSGHGLGAIGGLIGGLLGHSKGSSSPPPTPASTSNPGFNTSTTVDSGTQTPSDGVGHGQAGQGQTSPPSWEEKLVGPILF